MVGSPRVKSCIEVMSGISRRGYARGEEIRRRRLESLSKVFHLVKTRVRLTTVLLSIRISLPFGV